MNTQTVWLERFSWLALWPLLTGLYGLGIAFEANWFAAVLLGSLALTQLGCGFALFFSSGQRMFANLLALTVLLGLPIWLLTVWFVPGFAGFLILLALPVNWIVAGKIQLEAGQGEVSGAVPAVANSFTQGLVDAAKVSADLAILGFIVLGTPVTAKVRQPALANDLHEALADFEARGFIDEPERFHATPPAIQPDFARKTLKGRSCEVMRWNSGYQPEVDIPGAEHWLGHAPCKTANAVVFRHTDKPRPWLIGIHGFQMGNLLFDFQLFPPEHYHQKLGLNLVLPTLPLHGPRKIGRLSGDGFFGMNLLDTLHAEANALWDLRGLLRWIRQQDDQPVAALGYSLGGYNTALLAAFEPLDAAIAGIPMVDIAETLWRHGPPQLLRGIENLDIDCEKARQLLTPVSPLSFAPQLPTEKRFVFAGSMDQFIPASQVSKLIQHWESPSTAWFRGSHLVFHDQPTIPAFVHGALAAGGLVNR